MRTCTQIKSFKRRVGDTAYNSWRSQLSGECLASMHKALDSTLSIAGPSNKDQIGRNCYLLVIQEHLPVQMIIKDSRSHNHHIFGHLVTKSSPQSSSVSQCSQILPQYHVTHAIPFLSFLSGHYPPPILVLLSLSFTIQSFPPLGCNILEGHSFYIQTLVLNKARWQHNPEQEVFQKYIPTMGSCSWSYLIIFEHFARHYSTVLPLTHHGLWRVIP